MSRKRKSDHIDLAFQSQVNEMLLDKRFVYEPMLAPHPVEKEVTTWFLGKEMRAPIWVSSMTGGTEKARMINTNLARACNKYGLGMGLGSCRRLLDGKEDLEDFDMRDLIGDDLPFYANLGIAQVEEVSQNKEWRKVAELITVLRADGLIIHVNPLQEWIQPEGDRIRRAPIETIQEALHELDYPLIVKEVGQGMGKESLRQLMLLPLAAIEFAAHGGTNFSKLETLRARDEEADWYEPLSKIGRSALQMAQDVNDLLDELKDEARCREFIVSGGIRDYLDGYYLTGILNTKSIYGQASGMLRYAERSFEELCSFIEAQINGYMVARAFLRPVK